MNYKIRNLNILDIRSMARILREVDMTTELFKETIGEVVGAAMKISSSTTEENEEDNYDADKDGIKGFIQAAIPLLDNILYILAESNSFWEFLADLLSLTYDDLKNVSFFDIKEILMELAKDKQVAGFFTSISSEMSQTVKSLMPFSEDTEI